MAEGARPPPLPLPASNPSEGRKELGKRDHPLPLPFMSKAERKRPESESDKGSRGDLDAVSAVERPPSPTREARGRAGANDDKKGEGLSLDAVSLVRLLYVVARDREDKRMVRKGLKGGG